MQRNCMGTTMLRDWLHKTVVSSCAKPSRSAPHMAGGGKVLQAPLAASIWHRSAAQPLSGVLGRSARTGMLLCNIIVGQYCVSFCGGH